MAAPSYSSCTVCFAVCIQLFPTMDRAASGKEKVTWTFSRSPFSTSTRTSGAGRGV